LEAEQKSFLTQDWKDAPRDSNDLEDEAVQVAFIDVPIIAEKMWQHIGRLSFKDQGFVLNI